ncbi:reverse transcriptase domain-containing protein [Niallia sp. 01092]|uniref:reverse transcriptase domain-containing protein n=1 Tax=Niallia sp. 01092 TaxID=3457759 RepID=UPI003FD0F4D3
MLAYFISKELIAISNRVKVELKSNNTVINTRFKSLTDFEDIANLLEIPVEFLWKILIRDKNINYRMFKLLKKNGNERTIYSPSTNLAILQKKLAYILTLNFNSHQKSHGFVKNRSIVSNASEHINKKFVLNFDLENFFESIKFRRVRHMFIAYFKFNDTVATTLANICCHPKGFLPQGAATSPIISNILAKSLDKELTRVAQHTKWSQYTRYADDITFSTNKRHFPKEIAYLDNDGNVILNENIVKIVEKYGFKINPEKTRLQNRKQHQSVTGIVVNEKLNIDRTYIRRVRSILNCIEKNLDKLDVAVKIFESKYPFRQRKEGNNPDMFLVLRGMISHVGHVKGKHDKVYLKLAKRFNEIAQINKLQPIKLPLSNIEFHERYTYIIDNPDTEFFITEDGDLGEFVYGQGTGFLLKDIGLVTNAHVISDAIDVLEFDLKFTKEFNIAYYKSTDHYIQQWAKIVCYDIDKDIAILNVKDMDISNQGYTYNEFIEKGQAIELIGFPDYRKGQEIRIQEGEVQGVRMHESKHRRYEISTTIYGGNSGGPIVNENNEVVGVAVKGATLNGVSPNEIIPISDVIELARKMNLLKA